jgi:hypothetical protein
VVLSFTSLAVAQTAAPAAQPAAEAAAPPVAQTEPGAPASVEKAEEPAPPPPEEANVPEPERPAVPSPNEPAPPEKATPSEPRVASQNKDEGVDDKRLRARDFSALPLSLEFRFGVNARLGASDNAFSEEELYDTAFGLGGWLSWNKAFSVGLEVEHSGLGRGTASSGDSAINTSYSMTNLWAGARVYPYRSERVDLYVSLRLGLAVQHLRAVGLRHDGPVGVPARSFACSDTDGPDLGFGGGLGSVFRLSRAAALFLRGDLVGQRLSGEVLSDCAVGVGSVTTAMVTGGFAYEFELDPQPQRSALNTR